MNHNQTQSKPRFLISEALNYFKIIFITLVICLFVNESSAAGKHPIVNQDYKITGKVISETGKPLAGVSVILKGTNKQTATDEQGAFSLSSTKASEVLVFSMVGYKTQEVPAKATEPVWVELKSLANDLDEIVVVGYGTQKKGDLTGAIAQFQMSDKFSQLPNTSIAQTLQGALPGLNVGQINKPGQNASISIRGLNSLSTAEASSSPLIVVDGMIFRGSLVDINPNDIGSITVLKDASSAAIYGSQSSNGVILIETKKGTLSEKPILSYSSLFSVQTPYNAIAPMGSKELEQYILDAHWERGSRIAPDYLEKNSSYSISPYLKTAENRVGYAEGQDFNWYDNFTQNGYMVQHDLDVKGGSKVFKYFLSGGYNNSKGFLKNDDFKRYNFRANFNTEINSWLNMGVQSYVSMSDYSGITPSIDNLFSVQPWAPIRDVNGNYSLTPDGLSLNPYLIQSQSDVDKRLNLIGNLFAEVKLPFVKNLMYRINYNHNYTLNTNNGFNDNGASFTGSGFKNSLSNYFWSLDNIVSFKHSINNIHNFDATLVYGFDKLTISNTNASARNFTNKTLGFDRLQSGDPTLFTIVTGAEEEKSIYSMGRLSYNFKDKYFFTGTIRRDGFSGFGTQKKIGVFPTMSVAWALSQEEFFKSDLLEFFKIRASYGSSGRRAVGRYTTKAVVSSSPQYTFGDGAAGQIGQWLSKLGNDNLTWENTTGMNLGADFTLRIKNHAIRGNFEFYANNTQDILFDIQLPTISGFGSIASNIGKVKNHGYEFALASNIMSSNNFKWEASVNFSLNRNKIVSIIGANKDGIEGDLVANSLFIGQPQNVIYDYEIAGGMWQIADKNAGTIPLGFGAGTYKIVDQNQDGKFSATDDRKILGYKDPAYRFGISNTFSYKDLSLYVFINSIQGGNNYYKGFAGPPWTWSNYESVTQRNGPKGGYDYWTPENPNAKYRRLDWPPSYEGKVYDSRSFVRLQDVTLSYTPKWEWYKKLSVSNMRVFVSGKNLLTFTKWDGVDPETGIGLDMGDPIMTNYSLGVNIQF